MIKTASGAGDYDPLDNGSFAYDGIEDETVGIKEYSITSYGIDFDVLGIVRRLNDNNIEIPEFQREYIWPRSRASLFIESLLLGLPVPGIFLYRDFDSEIMRVVDGHQRLRSLQDYYPSNSDNQRHEQLFKLQALDSKFNDKAYNDLADQDRRKLDNSIIHATIMSQISPTDGGSSQFSVFERLNTGGMLLRPQEIRSAIYQGEFNNLLGILNENISWRKLVGNKDKRKRDQELILRFLSLYFKSSYESPMKSFLNRYMSENRHLNIHNCESICSIFESVTKTILEKIGEDAFKPLRAVNAAVVDAVMIGVAHRLETGNIRDSLREKYDSLINNEIFVDSTTQGTSQSEKVRKRIELATEAFANAE